MAFGVLPSLRPVGFLGFRIPCPGSTVFRRVLSVHRRCAAAGVVLTYRMDCRIFTRTFTSLPLSCAIPTGVAILSSAKGLIAEHRQKLTDALR